MDDFSAAELLLLREHDIVLYAERVIFKANPPMPASKIAEIRTLCSAPIPEQIIEFWSITAGGSIDYDMIVLGDGYLAEIDWNQVFINGSRRSRTLVQWIKLEQELAEEGGLQWDGKIPYLPICGEGFDDRILVMVEPGPEYGSVIGCKSAWPSTVKHQVGEDSIDLIAPDLYSAFGALSLAKDPLTSGEESHTGEKLLKYLKSKVKCGLPKDLADKLIKFYRRAINDWPSALESKSFANQPVLSIVALREAVDQNAPQLVARLVTAGASVDKPLWGRALPAELALIKGKYDAARALVDAGSPVTTDILSDVEDFAEIPTELIISLLAHGALPSAEIVARCAAAGKTESALILAKEFSRTSHNPFVDFAEAKRLILREFDDRLNEVLEGLVTEEREEEILESQIKNLEKFELVQM